MRADATTPRRPAPDALVAAHGPWLDLRQDRPRQPSSGALIVGFVGGAPHARDRPRRTGRSSRPRSRGPTSSARWARCRRSSAGCSAIRSTSTRSGAGSRSGPATSCRSCSGCGPVLALSGTLAGEAAKGSLDLLASTPVARRSIALQKLGGHVTAVAFALVLITVITYLASPAFALLPGDRFGIADAFGFALLTGLLMLACGSASFAAAPVRRPDPSPRDRPDRAVRRIRHLVLRRPCHRSIDALGPLSFFDWTAGHRPLAGVTDWPSVGLLAVATVVLFAIGVIALRATRPRLVDRACLAASAVAARRCATVRSRDSSPIGWASRSRGASGSACTGR